MLFFDFIYNYAIRSEYIKTAGVRCTTWVDLRNEQEMPTKGLYVQNAELETCENLCNQHDKCEAFDYSPVLKWCRTFTNCKGGNLTDMSGNENQFAVYTKNKGMLFNNLYLVN